MKKFTKILCPILFSVTAMLTISCSDDDDNGNNGNNNGSTTGPDLVFYGLSKTNSLVQYNANNTNTPLSTQAITGLAAGESIKAIDFRPATGQLYGLSSLSRIYVINHQTAVARAIGTTAFTPALAGDLAGFDFNPTVDRIRVVTSSGQNLRVHPETGVVAFTDGNLNPGSPVVGSAAYTNSAAGASSTALYVIDFASGNLHKQDPPNDGKLTAVGSLTTTVTAGADGGFDISPDNSVALASFTESGSSKLFTIDTNTGKATNIGNLSVELIGLAIPTSPVAYAVDSANNLQIFNFQTPGAPVSKPIANLSSGENIVGIDLRPANGALYGLGSEGRLYKIDLGSGAATQIGGAPVALLLGTSFGFDFNPLVDRIRIVSNTGQNLRVNPNDGTLAAADGTLNPGSPAVTAAAYTNNFAGTTTTTLFTIDTAADALFKQDPPNDGTLTSVGNLGFDAVENNGFDIGGTSNIGYAVLTTGTASKIYSVNTTTGAATAVADFPNAVRGFAVGLGF